MQEQGAQKRLPGVRHAQRLAAPLAGDGRRAGGEGRGHRGAVHRQVIRLLLLGGGRAQEGGVAPHPRAARGDDVRAGREEVGLDAAVRERPATGEEGHAAAIGLLPGRRAEGVRQERRMAGLQETRAQDGDLDAIGVAPVAHGRAVGLRRADGEDVLGQGGARGQGAQVAHAVAVGIRAVVGGGEKGQEVLVRPDEAVDGPGGEGVDRAHGAEGVDAAPTVGVDARARVIGLLEDGVEEGRDVGAPGYEAVGGAVCLEEKPRAGRHAAKTAVFAARAVAQDAPRHVRAVAAPVVAVAHAVGDRGGRHGLPRLRGDAHHAAAQAGVEGLGALLPQIAGDTRGEAAVKDRHDLPRAGEPRALALQGIRAEEALPARHIVVEANLVGHIRAQNATLRRECPGQGIGGGFRPQGRVHAQATQSRLQACRRRRVGAGQHDGDRLARLDGAAEGSGHRERRRGHPTPRGAKRGQGIAREHRVIATGRVPAQRLTPHLGNGRTDLRNRQARNRENRPSHPAGCVLAIHRHRRRQRRPGLSRRRG